MRSHLLGQLQKHQIPVQEIPWDIDLIQTFEAIAYSNSVVGVIPFQAIQGANFSLNALQINHPALRHLQHLSGQLVV